MAGMTSQTPTLTLLTLPDEEWRPDVASPYEVSTLGRVRSWAWRRYRLLRPSPNQSGYRLVSWRKDGRRYSRQVSHMVLETFVGPAPTPRHWALHGDDDPGNDALTNLRWGLPVENSLDAAVRNRHKGRRLSKEEVLTIKGLLRTEPGVYCKRRYWTTRRLALHFKVTQVTIVHIARGRTHRDVPWPERTPAVEWLPARG
jgi:hypothetical protein